MGVWLTMKNQKYTKSLVWNNGYWMGEERAKTKNAHNFCSKIESKTAGGSLRSGFLDDIKLDLNEDYCKAVG